MPKSDPIKDAPAAAATAVVDPEPTSAPQTKEEIAATEQALGLTPPPKVDAKTQTLPAKVPVRLGVAPTNIEEGWRLAQFIAQSELVPKGYRGRPADVLVAIQYGMEVGLPPMAALHSIFVTNGRPSLWGDGFLAVIMASPAYKDHDEYYMVDGTRQEFLVASDLGKDDTMAVATFWRTDSQRPRTATFSIGKAKKAGLWTKQGPWQEYPDRMLKFRARGFAGHDAFPDVLRGMRTVEEMRDAPPEDDEPELPRVVRRLSETKTETVAPAAVEQQDRPGTLETRVVVAKVVNVEQFLGGFRISLSDGKEVMTENMPDALELEKFKGTDHALRVTYLVRDQEFVITGFSIAD